MIKKKKQKPPANIYMTPERASKSDVVRVSGRSSVKTYAEILYSRKVITKQQLDTWVVIERLAARARYSGSPKGSKMDAIGGGGIEEAESERYVAARQKLGLLFNALGFIGTSTVEFICIMGEDAEQYARRMPGWNRHKVLGALTVSLDIAAGVLGIGYRK